jgi:hypothetical protein
MFALINILLCLDDSKAVHVILGSISDCKKIICRDLIKKN